MMDPYYKESYLNLLDISKDRFQYMNELDVENSLYIDKNLSAMASFGLSDKTLDLLLDYDKFILYISDRVLELTAANQHLKRKDLIQLNDLFEISTLMDTKTPNQKDFPLINLFFVFI